MLLGLSILDYYERSTMFQGWTLEDAPIWIAVLCLLAISWPYTGRGSWYLYPAYAVSVIGYMYFKDGWWWWTGIPLVAISLLVVAVASGNRWRKKPEPEPEAYPDGSPYA
jgi:hypothetical protein